MSVRVLFEIQATPGEPIAALLAEVRTEMVENSPAWDRMVAGLMILRGTQMLESAAIREHDDRVNKRRRNAAAATRKAKRA